MRKQLNIRTTEELDQAIDDIRRMTTPIPSVTDAIKQAIFAHRDSLVRSQKQAA